jgi:hypothetical protein
MLVWLIWQLAGGFSVSCPSVKPGLPVCECTLHDADVATEA